MLALARNAVEAVGLLAIVLACWWVWRPLGLGVAGVALILEANLVTWKRARDEEPRG